MMRFAGKNSFLQVRSARVLILPALLQQNQFLGGKGLNQSVALARAGIFVEHADVYKRQALGT